MRSSTLVAVVGLVAASALTPVVQAAEEEGYRHGRVRFVEAGVTLHRATEVSAEEALANVPFLPGDRVWSDASGRVEFQFPDGTLVRLDNRSKLDYSGHEEGQEERVVLRLWSGSLIARVRTAQAARFEIETPAGSVELLDQAMVRIDIEAGEARVSVYRGEAVLDDGRGRVRLAAGERTVARWGGAAAEPEAFDIAPDDDFARWDEARDSEERYAARASEYLPNELDPYAGELERNGSWRFEASVGYVWTPRVAVGWSPYTSGRWSWTPFGWTWVPYETWGWAPFHYGRWGFSVSAGWWWAPDRTWGPAWVSWGVGRGYVGWCPLGYGNRPVHPWGGHNRGHAVPRRGGHGGWNVVREGDFGHGDVARRRLPLAGIEPGALQVAESANLRPTRNARSLAPGNPARAISRRATPGDFVRELAVDNKTTIPSPWLQRGRARAEEARARQSQDRGTATAARPRGGSGDSATASSASAPWYAPRRAAAAPRAGATASSSSGRASRPHDTQAYRETQTYGRGESSRPASRPEAAARTRVERSDRPVRDSSGGQSSVRPRQERDSGQSLGGQARYRSASPRRDDEVSARSGASRSEPGTPRAESTRPSRSDAGERSSSASRSNGGSRSSGAPSSGSARSSGAQQRSSGGQGAGGGQQGASRPQRHRN